MSPERSRRAPCVDARFEDAILDGAHRGSAFTDAEVAHLQECQSCRGAVERALRMAEAWSALEPTADEVRRARVRFVATRAAKRKAKIAPAAFALAVVLVAAVANAAVRAGIRYFDGASHRAAATRASLVAPPGPESPPVPAVDPEPTLDVTPQEAPPRRDGVPVPAHPSTAPAALHAPTAIALDATRVARTSTASDRADVANHRASASAAERAAAWATAAEAMRAADYGRAEAAFAALAESSDPHTRDAARLARAQVWVAQGRLGQARPELQDLALNGATEGLRSRAAAAVERLR